jgi:hypothetical protein
MFGNLLLTQPQAQSSTIKIMNDLFSMGIYYIIILFAETDYRTHIKCYQSKNKLISTT